MHYDSTDRTLPHNPLKALVAPRPIGWISSMDKAGALNLAPYSYFNAIASDPDMVMFSSYGRKDALAFAEEGGEFVCSLATYALRDAMNATSAPLERGRSEFAFAGLTPAPSRKVRPPRVAESPAAIECRWVRTVPLVPLEGGEASHFMVIGQVVSVYIDDAFVRDGQVDTAAMGPIMRGGHTDYFTVTPESRFELKRPPGAGQ
ncbi:flavin reductase [Methylobacterium sp. Leaf399]|uniref:flavin reductase family protein n=1 Tax=unclassified Methylobacterium TaxID=2615210 RepID=UPI0006F83058|nr:MULTISPECIES: flavin reductase family protein [unclassified Methylobacterium]KQP50459.1 flavin reductase [Methylobacterium sp. Leaf108]KQT08644.1 flavin reductase [Methylobacterium sp. Leaf399]KQT78706.1 flavin reductase [Methylobacterium sp. Leaf466]